MRRIHALAITAVLSVAFLFSAPPAAAADFVYATISCERATAPFTGLFRYRLVLHWSLDDGPLSTFIPYLDLRAFPSPCSGTPIVFDSPSGEVEGWKLGLSCSLPLEGAFYCQGDGDIPAQLAAQGSVVSFTPPAFDGCNPKAASFSVITFYSSRPPAPPAFHPRRVGLRHDARFTVGHLFGTLPDDALQAIVGVDVIVNEFVVRPHAGDDEFVEVHNRRATAATVSNWTLRVSRPDRSATYRFPNPTTIPAGGYFVAQTDWVDTCYTACPPAQGQFLYDPGAVIQLRDAAGTLVDQVGYGNLGGAAISCPLIVPAGRTPPPGFAGGRLEPEAARRGGALAVAALPASPETLSTSTSRIPNGHDSGIDAEDFNLVAPTPNAANTGAASDPGSGVRINGVYVKPVNGDGIPPGEGLELYNPLSAAFDVNLLHVSDGLFIQPLLSEESPDRVVWVGSSESFRAYHGVNATVSFELEADDRLDLLELRGSGLTVIDQLGWWRVPEQFPDSCLVRSPTGTGPSTGWDWVSSGGDVNLFYMPSCGLESANNAAGDPAAREWLDPPMPNPARGPTRIAFQVPGGEPATHVTLTVYDAAGRRVARLVHERREPGPHVLWWNGARDDGSQLAPGAYWIRLAFPQRGESFVRPWRRTR